VSDAIVLTSQQPGDPRRSRRSSAPRGDGRSDDGVDSIESLVPEGFRFEGTVAFDGRVRVDGSLTGRVEGRGRLEIGPTGEVKGDLDADELVVAGRVEGDLDASLRIELRAGAQVRGALRTPSLTMDEGALLDGPCGVGEGMGEGADESAE